MRVPRDLWIALQRFSAWVDPSLIAEWTRMMRGYARSQQRTIDEGRIGAAMTWCDPVRDVTVSRSIALQMMDAGQAVHCVWTGRRPASTWTTAFHGRLGHAAIFGIFCRRTGKPTSASGTLCRPKNCCGTPETR
jgi:hypothetical protein